MKQVIKEFHDEESIATPLENCQESGYKPMFIPELVDARMKSKVDWFKWYTTPSVRATGKTRQGNTVVVYAHIPNYFSNPSNIRKAIEEESFEIGDFDPHAGIMPQKEFQKLVDAEDNKRVFVVDYDKLTETGPFCYFLSEISEALENPRTIPFFGGRDRAEKYITKYTETYGRDSIMMGSLFHDNLMEQPVGRLLFLGGNSAYGFDDSLYVGGHNRFLGVRSGDARKINAPNLDEMLKYSKNFVPKTKFLEFQQGLKQLYKR